MSWFGLSISLRRRLDQAINRFFQFAGRRNGIYSCPFDQPACEILTRVPRCKAEAWICFSSMSYQLLSTWKLVSHAKVAWAFIPQGSILLEDKALGEYAYASNIKILPYTQFSLLLLCVSRLLRFSRLTVRVPHLHPGIIKQILINLDSLRLLRLNLYDDGFLGVLEHPSVCTSLKPIFSSICCWDIESWGMSASTLRAVCRLGSKPIQVLKLPIQHAIKSWSSQSSTHRTTETMIIESKYMDYSYLASLMHEGKLALTADACIDYFQHPWELKRNKLWPDDYQRQIVESIPIEKYLVANISTESHVIAGMTSTVIFLCELVKRGVLPKHWLTLLVKENDSSVPFSNNTEPASYCHFMAMNYSGCVSLKIVLNGTVLV